MTAATEFRTRALTAEDAVAAGRLSTLAGWNQTYADWRAMIGFGEAWGQVDADGALVASALLLPYQERIAWIAMVLTDPRHRRRGLATLNLDIALRRCEERGWLAGLDATPEGQRVYAPRGFRETFPLRRWRAQEPRPPGGGGRAAAVRPMALADVSAAAELDAQAFGARREPLLAYLRAARPESALVALRAGKLAGFVLARGGRLTSQIGPLVARDPDIALLLLKHALQSTAGAVVVDVPDHQSAVVQQLERIGFTPERPFTRMVQSDEPPGRPELLRALAGPEFG